MQSDGPGRRIAEIVAVTDWPLFTSALLSATLLRESSEALLLLRLHDDGAGPPLVLSAAAGILLGGLITYAHGAGWQPRAAHKTLVAYRRRGSAAGRVLVRPLARFAVTAALAIWVVLRA